MKFWGSLAIVAAIIALALAGAIGTGHATFLGIGWGIYALFNFPAKK